MAADEQKGRERAASVESQFDDLPDNGDVRDEGFNERPHEPRFGIVDNGEAWHAGPGIVERKDADNGEAGPEPSPDLPAISAQQQEIVDRWREELPESHEDSNPDDSAVRIRRFSNDHPDLFPCLYLEDQSLFELGAEFARRKQWSKYADLLKEIRQKHPEMYQRGFDYFDYALILDAIATGQADSAPSYFDLYRKFRSHNPDKVAEAIHLLAWTDREKELLEFIEATSNEPWYLPYEIEEESGLYWPVFIEQARRIDSQESPEAVAGQIAAALALRTRDAFTDLHTRAIRDGIASARSMQSEWDVTQCRTGNDIRVFYQALAWRFCVFVHRIKGIGWTKSRYCANRLLGYWTDVPEGKKPKKTFRISEAYLDKYIATRCRMFFFVEGVRGAGLVEAVYHFADFLAAHGQQAEESTEEIHALCGRLQSKLLKTVDSSDPVVRLWPELAQVA